MQVFVLGGYGAMAQATVRDLLESGVDRVGIAGRSVDKAKALARELDDDRAEPLEANARFPDRLGRSLREWDVLINSTWHGLNLEVMDAAIRAGLHYVDLGGLYHMTLRQLALDSQARDAGVTCLLGMGSTPGTMNVLGAYGASKLDRIGNVRLRSSGAVVRGGEPGRFVPPYAIRTILDEFQLDCPVVRDGKLQMVPARSGLEQAEFDPPVGLVEGYYTIHSELATMPENLGKGLREMDFIVAFPPEFRRTIATIVELGLASHEPVELHGQKVEPFEVAAAAIESLPKPREPELDIDVQRCELVGERDGRAATLRYEAWTGPHERWNLGGGTVDTGVPPSIAAQWLGKGRIGVRGVVPPEVAINPLPFFRELHAQGRGIDVYEKTDGARRPLFQ